VGLTLNPATGAITGTPTNASEGSYSFTLTATNSEGSIAKVFAGAVITQDLGFLGLGPTRLLDTRLAGKRPAGSVSEILVRGVAGVPADATTVVLNVTVHDPSGSGYLTVYPCGSPIPNASNANFLAGQTIPNSVTAAVGEGGKVCFFTTTATNIIVDLNGAYSPTLGTGTLLGLTPGRLLDPRGPSGKLAAGVVRTVQVAGAGGVPADVSSVVLNVTVDAPDALGYVTAFPCDSGRPEASNLNFLAGQTVANAVTVAVGASGMVCFYSTATTHLIVDVEAAYSPGSGIGDLFWMEPTRMFDSRGAHGEVVAGSIVELNVAGAFGIPASTIAVALNVTVDSPNTGGYVTVFPCAAAVPYASNLNFSTGQTVANSVLGTVGTGGKICFYVTATTHLIIDVNAAYVVS
jgi:PKD repeat protein